MCLNVLSTCMYVDHGQTVLMEAGEDTDPPRTGLEKVMSCRVAIGNRTWSLCKSSECSSPQSRFSSPRTGLLKLFLLTIPIHLIYFYESLYRHVKQVDRSNIYRW